MGRRYKFELFYPAGCLPDALNAVEGMLPTWRRELTGKPIFRAWGMNLRGLTPDAPLFARLALLFPADNLVRGFRHDWEDAESEWTDEGVECLPIGGIDLAVRVGRRYGQLTFAAATSWMSDLFRNSAAVWERFAWLLRAGGGMVGLFNDESGSRRYPLLPDGQHAITLNFFDFVLEERPAYWHLDVDRFATAALLAPKVAAG